MKIRNWIKKIALSLLPTNCPLCGMKSHHAGCCQACEMDLPWLNHACARCGYSLAFDSPACGRCLKRLPPYDNTVALFRYESPIDYLILAVKFNKNLAYARIIGEMMSKKIQAHYDPDHMPDIILPVPLHPERLKERGFNQALEIARPISKKLNIPLSINDCVRVIETKPQATVSADKRKQNIKNAFTLTRTINAKHIAIFDDVVTTGSTVAEITRVLKKHGVQQVDIWCCARTLL